MSLDLVDYLSFLVDDPDTKVITLMVEGIRRPNEFMAVAEQALEKGKPILAVKLGRSEMGKRQAISHTGSLAGADEVFDAMCKRFGIIRCPTLEDMTEITLAFMLGRFPKGSRAAIVVNSGGMKGLICDHCDDLNTNLAQLSDKTKEAVRPLIPAELAVENPLECGVAGFGDEAGFINIVKLHAEDPGVDLMAIHGELPRGQTRNAGLFKSVLEATDKPVLAFGRSTYSCTDESRAFQEEAGMPFLQAIKPTLRALAGLGFTASAETPVFRHCRRQTAIGCARRREIEQTVTEQRHRLTEAIVGGLSGRRGGAGERDRLSGGVEIDRRRRRA